MRRKTIEEVEKIFAENDCKLLEDTYINNRTNMKYTCQCGNIDYITLDSFMRGARCSQCASEKRVKNQRLTLDEVMQIFKDENCILVESTYKNARTPLNYICSCGNKSKITLTNFKAGNRCKECQRNKAKERLSYTQIEVEEMLKSRDLTLVGSYYGFHNKLKYNCHVCGYIGEKSLNSIINTKYPCRNCFIRNVSGENSVHWNNEITEEDRINGRFTPEDFEWKKNVKIRDDFTCQCCFERGVELHSHHILNYADNKEVRYDIDNGVTVCKPCHIEFHVLYGKRNNTKEQFIEFKNSKQFILQRVM